MKYSRRNRRSNIPRLFAIFILAFFLIPIAGNCKTIYVPADSATIQAGIDGAVEGDTVLVAPGLYTGPGNEGINFGGKNIVLKSEAGAEATTLLTTTDSLRTIIIDSGEDSTCILDGFTISGGYEDNFAWDSSYHGGIYINASSPVLQNCVIQGCFAYEGGGLGIFGQPKIIMCEFRNNRATRHGGGILARGGPIEISNSRIEKNMVYQGYDPSVVFGGGIAILGGDVRIQDCHICENRAARVRDQASTGIGGGIYSAIANLEILNSVLARNSAIQGGTVVSDGGTAQFNHCLIYNNIAKSRGGIVCMVRESPVIQGLSVNNCTIACNYSSLVTADGVSIIRFLAYPKSVTDQFNEYLACEKTLSNALSGTYSVTNNIFAFNSAAAISLEVDTITMEISNNNVWCTVSGPDYGGLLADQTGINGNISVDPLFCDVSDSGFTLDVSSPCVGAGSDGGTIGAYDIGCDMYDGGGPKTVTAVLTEWFIPNQDSVDAALQRSNPWDTLQIDLPTGFATVRRIVIDKPLYLFGAGMDTDNLLRSESPDPDGNTICIDLQSFCYLDDFLVDARAIQSAYGDTTAAIRFSGSPSIATNCRSGASSYGDRNLDLPMVCVASSPLIRNCALAESIYYRFANGSPCDVVASYNYWGYDSHGYIDLHLMDGNDFEGVGYVIFEPFLDGYPTDVTDDDNPLMQFPFMLMQNCPNPFNGSTSISYYLPRSGHARLEIYNILGQRVKTVYDGNQSAGWHSREWNGRDVYGNPVATGVYMYKLTFDSEISTKKMMFLK